jgi:hypothetical protein
MLMGQSLVASLASLCRATKQELLKYGIILLGRHAISKQNVKEGVEGGKVWVDGVFVGSEKHCTVSAKDRRRSMELA